MGLVRNRLETTSDLFLVVAPGGFACRTVVVFLLCVIKQYVERSTNSAAFLPVRPRAHINELYVSLFHHIVPYRGKHS